MEETVSGLAALSERLRRARRRARLGLFRSAALWSAVAALAAFLVLELTQRRLPESFAALFGAAAPAPVWWALAVLAAGLVAGLALAVLRTPGLDSLARRADRRFGLDERVSTAFGLAPAAPRSLVARALLDDTARRIEAVDPRRLAPFRLDPVAWAVPVLALAAAAVVAFVPAVEPASVPGAAPQSGLVEPLAEDERLALSADVQRVAAFVAEQADTRSDAFMAAVARNLQSLGDRLIEDPQTSRADVVRELAALRDYAATAASDWRGSVGQRIPELLDTLAQQAETPPAPTETPQLPPNMMAETASGEGAAPAAPGEAAETPEGEPVREGESALEAMLEEMQQAAAGSGRPMTDADYNAPPEVSLDYYSVAQAQNAARRAEAAGDPESAQIIGPSSDARAGDSLLAGQGSDAVDAGAGGDIALQFETGEDFVLEANDTGEGRRIEMEIAPPAGLTEVTEESLAASASGWVRAPERDVARPFVPAADRDWVSAYRLGLAGQAGQ